MRLKAKPVKRTPTAPAPRAPARVGVARTLRGPDLGDRRLQLLLGAVRWP